jgi:carbonic anhydrase/acetyltransferase-like protein (isoleucine patch superfamily)
MERARAANPDPTIAADAFVASSALIVGDVRVGPGCVVDHGAVIVATGPPIELGSRVVVMPGAVVRSTGGEHRPAHRVIIGEDCLIGPQAALAGCEIGAAVYVATQAMVFHGAVVGEGCRLGAGSIVHTNAMLPPRSRVGMRQCAVASPDGGPATITSDLDEARSLLAQTDFFGRVFGAATSEQEDLVELHRHAARDVADEIRRRGGSFRRT